jgi:hypothetical protein
MSRSRAISMSHPHECPHAHGPIPPHRPPAMELVRRPQALCLSPAQDSNDDDALDYRMVDGFCD